MQKKTSKASLKVRSGGVAVAEQLKALDARVLFTVPGETFIAALDGLYDTPSIQTVVCRHEGGAAMMAEAWAKVTGKPGIAFVTRAPGLANATSGLVVARQDQTPLVVLVGLPKTTLENRGDLQTQEIEAMMGALAKWTTIVRDPQRIPETLARAYQLAQSGRPGPVVIGLPEDCLNAPCNTCSLTPRRLPASRVRQSDL
ncbi:MAG: thiamine pyrophosphate-binding protein, partial [Alphaproteobacteria bacterium]|nr:thiamine pyrophosphate-binding protein [Alphaproteobacteria bacterium]